MLNQYLDTSINLPQNVKDWLLFLQTEVGQKRVLIDSDTDSLISVLKEAIRLNVLAVTVPTTFGGIDLDLSAQGYFYRSMSRVSGALAFLCTQHSTASSIIYNGSNKAIKDKYLHNKSHFAVAFAHLRNIDNPPVVGIKDGDSYIVSGPLRYVTGYKIFDMLLLGFVVDGREIFALTKFVASESLVILKQLNLVAGNSTRTISCKLVQHKIDNSMIISDNPVGTLVSMRKSRHIASFQIGLALAVLDLISTSKWLNNITVRDTYNKFIHEITLCESELFDSNLDSTIKIRVKITGILNQLFWFGDQIFKGSASLDNHPFLLLKREAQLFASLASTEETLIETCHALNLAF
jgi:hypothetical protein